MKYFNWVILLVFSLSLDSCTLFFPKEEPNPDSPIPQNYNPIFVSGQKKYIPNTITKPSIAVSRIDASNPGAIKIQAHLLDSNRTMIVGLSPADYKKIFCKFIDSINGAEKDVKNFKIKEVNDNDKKLALAIVLDHSGSMGDDRAIEMQKALKTTVNLKNPNDMFAIIKYDNNINTEIPFTADKSELIEGLTENGLLGYGGTTAICSSISSALDELTNVSNDYIKAVLIFTDGYDNSSKISKDSLINLSKINKIPICAVDFGDYINENYMITIAEQTGGIYSHIYRANEFKNLFEDLYRRLKSYFLIEYNPTEFGNHKIKMKICLPNETVQTTANFNNMPDIGAICLLNINFDFDKAIIKKESEEAIDNFYILMKAYPNMKIELRGHTDSLSRSNDPNLNLQLSQKRADAVKAALIKKGIDGQRISAVGYGDKIPIADNKTEEGRALNRRTEFIILSNKK